MFNILVLCTGNSARSILAEAIFTRDGGEWVKAWSAGSNPTWLVHTTALRLLTRQGLPGRGYRSSRWPECAPPAARPRPRYALAGGHRGDRRQRLPPEAQRQNAQKLLVVHQLARGVPLERRRQLRCLDAAAVIGHADRLYPTACDLNRDPQGPGVQGVLHQLLHDRRRALDHFARGDAGGDFRR